MITIICTKLFNSTIYIYAGRQSERKITIYIHISKGRNSIKNCSIDQIFFLQVQDVPIIIIIIYFIFLFFESYHFLKIMKGKSKKKTEFRGDRLDFLWPSWIAHGDFLILPQQKGQTPYQQKRIWRLSVDAQPSRRSIKQLDSKEVEMLQDQTKYQRKPLRLM